jgi:translocation and assembly module TamB
VGISSCELDPLTQKVTLRGLSAFEKGSDEPVFFADEAQVSLRAVKLTGGVELDRVVVSRPRLSLDLSRPRAKSDDDSCPLDALKRAEIDELEITGAEVRVKLPGDQRVELTGIDFGWSVRRGVAEFNLDAHRGIFQAAKNSELSIGKLSVEGGLDVKEELLEINRGELALDDATLNVSGKIESLCDPLLALDSQVFLPMSSVARLSGSREKVSGHLWSRISLSGRPSEAKAQIDALGSQLQWGRYQPGDFTAHLSVAGDELTLTELKTEAGAGWLKVNATMRLSRNLPVKGKLEVDNASFGKALEKSGLSGSWVEFPATGRATFAGNLLPAPNLFGDLELKSGRFVLAGRAFDAPTPPPGKDDKLILSFAQGRATAHVGVHPDRVELTNVHIDAGQWTRVSGDVTLNFDPLKGLAISGHTDALDLSDFGQLSGIKWAGKGAAHFDVVGPYSDVKVDSQVSFRDFEYWHFNLGVVQGSIKWHDQLLDFPALTGQKGKTQYFGVAQLDFSKPEVHATGHVQIPSGKTQDLIDLMVRMSPSIESFQGVLLGDVSGTADFDCPLHGLAGTIALDFANTTYYGRRFGNGRMNFRFLDGETMVLDKTVMLGPLGKTTVEGAWAFDGPLDYTFRFDEVSLEELIGPEKAKALSARGTLTMVGTVGGDATTPVVTAYLKSPQIIFGGKSLGATYLEGRLQGRDFQLWGSPFGDARGSVKLKVKDPFPWEGTLTLQLPEIRPLLPEGAISQGLSGALGGSVNASGNFRDTKALKRPAGSIGSPSRAATSRSPTTAPCSSATRPAASRWSRS